MLVNQELVSETDSSSTPARFVLEERLGRMPALEMEDHLWSVRPSLVDGLWWVWLPGALDVPLNYQESTPEFHISQVGSITNEMYHFYVTIFVCMYRSIYDE